MATNLKKSKVSDKLEQKIQKAKAKAKQIHWNKYVGKIKLPEPLSYQEKIRDEWW